MSTDCTRHVRATRPVSGRRRAGGVVARLRVVGCVLAVWGCAVALVNAAELKTKTLEAWERYVTVTEARMQTQLDGEAPFLWVDSLVDDEREAVYARLRGGEVVIDKLETREHGDKIGSPDIKVGRSPGRSDQELCDLGRNRLIHGFFWDLPEQYFLASVDGRLRRPRSGWGACSAAAKSRRKVFNLWLLLDDRWAGDTAQVVPVR